MTNHERKGAATPDGARATGAKAAGAPAAARAPQPESKGAQEPELDLAIDEIAPTRNLKEGFTGQER